MQKPGAATERCVPTTVPLSPDPEAGNISVRPGTSEGRMALVAMKMMWVIRTAKNSFIDIPTPVFTCMWYLQ